MNDRDDLWKLKAKGDIGFFIGYAENSRGYRVYNRRTKKVIEIMNVKFDELSVMDFETRNLEPALNHQTSGHISSGLVLNQASSTITTGKPSKRDSLTYDDYMGNQPKDAQKTVPATPLSVSPLPQTLITPPASTTKEQQEDMNNNDDVLLDDNHFVNLFATTSTELIESLSRTFDPSNMHNFSQIYPSVLQWTRDHPLEQVLGDPTKRLMTR
ncbi:hypothetical protein Tco_0098560 [Tanacetum coccineum]